MTAVSLADESILGFSHRPSSRFAYTSNLSTFAPRRTLPSLWDDGRSDLGRREGCRGPASPASRRRLLRSRRIAPRSRPSNELCVADDTGAAPAYQQGRQLDSALKMVRPLRSSRPPRPRIADRMTAVSPRGVLELLRAVQDRIDRRIDRRIAEATPCRARNPGAASEEQLKSDDERWLWSRRPLRPSQPLCPHDTIDQDSMPTGSIPAPTDAAKTAGHASGVESPPRLPSTDQRHHSRCMLCQAPSRRAFSL